MSHPAFARTDHRPWPLPRGPWLWTQTWSRLLFAHWPVPATTLRPFVPPGLTLQEREGTAWLGVVPFLLEVRHRGLPPVPTAGCFPEVNVRTYVEHEGREGVWFLSLDAASSLVVQVARWLFRLPYHRADMALLPDADGASDSAAPADGCRWPPADGAVRYTSRRRSDGASLDVRYAPAGPTRLAAPGSLEAWLTERYCLFAQDRRGGLHIGEIHHEPWPLADATAHVADQSLTAPLGLTTAGPPLLHHVASLTVALWNPRALGVRCPPPARPLL